MEQITYAEIQDWESQNQVFELIDVREDWEHERYNIGGKLLPLGELMSRREEIDIHKNVVVYCKAGVRSMIAIQRLQVHFPDTTFYNLKGGITSIKH